MEDANLNNALVQENSERTEEFPTKFCRHCGKKIAKEAVICPLCGCQVEEFKTSSDTPNVVINNTNTNSNINKNINSTAMMGRMKNKWVSLLLCFFLGWLGAHKFYEGKTGMGILYIFTMGLCGIGIVIDFVSLLFKPNPYLV